jgi:hypothetical protein
MNSAAGGGNTTRHPASSYLKLPKVCLLHRRCAALYQLCFRRWTLAKEIGASKTIGEIFHSDRRSVCPTNALNIEDAVGIKLITTQNT